MSIGLLAVDSLSSIDGVVHGFTDRHGGQSEGDFASLNLSYKQGDQRAVVELNRRRVLDALGRSDANFIAVKQVHGCDIFQVNHLASRLIEADGLWTRDPQAAIAVLVADCVPILIAALDGSAVACAHAGWRGTQQQIGAKMVQRLGKEGLKADKLAAAIGPAIGPCCFEIGHEVAIQLMEPFGDVGCVRQREDGRWTADLWELNKISLERAGVPSDRISIVKTCTMCTQDMYSHRRDKGQTGRQAGIIALKG